MFTSAVLDPVMVPLLVCSTLLLAIVIHRVRFWWQWRLSSPSRRRLLLADPWVRHGQEPLLEAIALLSPLIGVLGAVLALMRLLDPLPPELILPETQPFSAYARLLVGPAYGLVLSILALLVLFVDRALRDWRQALLDLQEA
jgi:hypothetical protein